MSENQESLGPWVVVLIQLQRKRMHLSSMDIAFIPKEEINRRKLKILGLMVEAEGKSYYGKIIDII